MNFLTIVSIIYTFILIDKLQVGTSIVSSATCEQPGSNNLTKQIALFSSIGLNVFFHIEITVIFAAGVLARHNNPQFCKENITEIVLLSLESLEKEKKMYFKNSVF